MNGITGFNPIEAESQINRFYWDFNHIIDVLQIRGIEPFYEQLSQNWFSPRAIKFENTHIPILNTLTHYLKFVCISICEDAVKAYNCMASANGYKEISYEYENTPNDIPYLDKSNDNILSNESFNNLMTMYTDPNRVKIMKEQLPDGSVGMNHAQVKVIVVSLKNQIKFSMQELDKLPIDIAFFDPNGEMKEKFKRRISGMIIKFNGEAEAISAAIEQALQEEIDLQKTAVIQSRESLNG